MNYNMDHNVGRIIAKLEEHQLMQDTLIIFLSDNGGKFLGKHGNESYNHPLRSEKGQVWDGGIRIPFSVTWKGTIPAGRKISDPIISLDILPTALAAAGIEASKEMQLDGVNLLPVLKGKTEHLDNRFLYWHMPNQAAIRDENWKLVMPNLADTNAHYELFHISSDIGESKNIADANPEQVARLKAEFDAWSMIICHSNGAGIKTA